MNEQIDKIQKYSIGQASEYLGVSIDTLRRWEKKGRINALRSPGGHRYFEKEDLDNLFGKKYTRDLPTFRPEASETEDQKITPPKSEPITNVETPIIQQTASQNSDLVRPINLPDSQPTQTQVADEILKPEIRIPVTQPITLGKIDFDSSPPPPPTPVASPISTTPSTEKTEKIKAEENKIHQDQSSSVFPKIESVLSHEQQERLEDIIQTDKKRKKFTIKTKWIIISLVIFAILDLVFAYVWFSSSAIVSPMP